MSMPTFAIHTVNVRLAFLYATHLDIPPPYTAPPAPLPFVEVPHTCFWGPGAAMAAPNKVLTDNFTPAQIGHDCGIGVIHVDIPVGPLCPVAIATSSCKVVFAAGTVLSDGKPTAGHFPPLINLLQCFVPVPLPIGGFLLVMNTVFVGMTLLDIFMGIVRIAIAIVIALIFNKLGSSAGKMGQAWQWVGKLGERFGTSWAGAMGNALLGTLAEDMVKGLVLGPIMEGKIALPYQIAELDLTNGQVKVFYWNVGGPNWTPAQNRSVGGLLDSAQQPTAVPSGSSPAQQATSGVPVLGG